MKTFSPLMCVVALFAIGCTESGGAPSFLEGQGSSPSPSVATEPAVNGELAKQAGLERIVYHVGPVDLPAGTSAESMSEKPIVMRFQLDRPMWIIGFEPKVVDAQGTALPSELLHLAVLLNTHEENMLCTTGSTGNPFAVASSLLTEVHLPAGYGYPLLPTDPIEARVLLQNPSEKGYLNVSFEMTLLAKPMNEFVTLKDVQPVFIELSPCDHIPVDLPPNEFAKRQVTYTLPNAGSLVLAQGALANYGAGVDLTKGKETTPFWSAEAELNQDHHITNLTPNPFEDANGIPFAKDASITLGLSFNNTSEGWIRGAFGGAMTYFTISHE